MKTIYNINIELAWEEAPSAPYRLEYAVETYEGAVQIVKAVEAMGGKARATPTYVKNAGIIIAYLKTIRLEEMR